MLRPWTMYKLMEEAPGDLLDGAGSAVDDAPPEDDAGGLPPVDDYLKDVVFPEGLEDDIKNDPLLKAYISEGKLDNANILKSMIHAKRMVGKDKTVLPTDKSTSEEWNEFYGKMGVPKDVADYGLEYNKDQIGEEFANDFKAEAHKLGILPSQANKLMEFYGKTVEKSMGEMDANSQASIQESREELTSVFGDAMGNKLQIANNVLQEFGGEELLSAMQGVGIQNNSKMVQFLVKVGEALGEDVIVEGGADKNAGSIADLQADLASLRANPAYFDGEHAEHAVTVKKHNDIINTLSKYGASANI